MLLTPILTLPNTFVADITGIVGQLFTDLSGYITLVIGVFLGILVIGAVISFLQHR